VIYVTASNIYIAPLEIKDDWSYPFTGDG